MSNLYFSKTGQQVKKEPIVDSSPQVQELSSTDRFIRTKETGDKIYLIENGNAHWIRDAKAYEIVGGKFGMEKIISYTELKSLNLKSESITQQNASLYVQDKIEEIPLKTYENNDEKPHETIPGLTSIIIPAYLKDYPLFHMTGNCIGSIREHTDKTKTPYEIILVLNGTKETIKIEKLEQTYANKVIENEENLGYAKAVNKGIRCAQGEFLAIINNDVLVYNHWLEDMQKELSNGLDLVMATPMYGMPYARAVEAANLREKSLNEPVSDFRDFSCVLTTKRLFNEIGLFNEEFFMYGEDLDLFRRMEQEGKKYASTKRVNTTHIIQATGNTMPEIPKIMNESKETLKKIWNY